MQRERLPSIRSTNLSPCLRPTVFYASTMLLFDIEAVRTMMIVFTISIGVANIDTKTQQLFESGESTKRKQLNC